MKARKWAISLLAVLLVLLVGFAGVMYYLDPLLQYGKESAPLTFYEYSEMYSNPGIAQQYEYDTVLVGTSMIENTDVDEFDTLIGCNAVRLPYSGGTALNMKTILDVCFSSKNNIKSVYWELDEFQLFSNPDETRYPLPEYLYREDTKKDIRYLLNLDIFYHYALKDIIGTLRGQVQPAERRGETFTGEYSKEAVIKSYTRPKQNDLLQDNTAYLEKVKTNLRQNIEPLIEANPDTEFVFYFAPFSVLYWDREIREGRIEVTLSCLEYAIEELLTYDNVRVFFYHNEKDIITNLDNYKDYSHYGNWINSYITSANIDMICRFTDFPICYVKYPLYYYYDRPVSLAHIGSRGDILASGSVMLEYAKNRQVAPLVKSLLVKQATKDFLSARYEASVMGEPKETIKKCNAYLKTCLREMLRNQCIRFSETVRYFVLYGCPRIYRMWRVKNDPTLLGWEQKWKKKRKRED